MITTPENVKTAESPVAAVPAGIDPSLLAEGGKLVAEVSGDGSGQAPPPLDGAPPLAAGGIFDEAVTTEGIKLIVETADEVIVAHFAAAALAAGGTAADSQRFANLAKLNPAAKPALIRAAVETCRGKGWNISPQHVGVVALLAWGRGIFLAASGVKGLGKINSPPPAPKPPENEPRP